MKKTRTIFLFFVLYGFLFLIISFPFSTYRERQITQFLEDRHSEYMASLNSAEYYEADTLEGWSNMNITRAHIIAMEYLIAETEHIMEKDSMYPFTPYTKAFSYVEMWRAVVPAYDGVVKEFWDFAGDNMYSAVATIKSETDYEFPEVLETEEYGILVDEIVASTETLNGTHIDTVYREVMDAESPKFLYAAVVQEKKRLAERAYTNYVKSATEKDYVGSLIHSDIIRILHLRPRSHEGIYWLDDAGYLVFSVLNINMYFDLFLMFILPLILSTLLVMLIGRKSRNPE